MGGSSGGFGSSRQIQTADGIPGQKPPSMVSGGQPTTIPGLEGLNFDTGSLTNREIGNPNYVAPLGNSSSVGGKGAEEARRIFSRSNGGKGKGEYNFLGSGSGSGSGGKSLYNAEAFRPLAEAIKQRQGGNNNAV